MKVPTTPGYVRSSSACHATAYGTSTSSAPNARMRSSFAAGAVSIATTVQGTPAARAAYATPWPALPALIVQTPRRRSASDNRATALAAPRDRKSTRLNSSHVRISYAVFCLKKKKKKNKIQKQTKKKKKKKKNKQKDR